MNGYESVYEIADSNVGKLRLNFEFLGRRQARVKKKLQFMFSMQIDPIINVSVLQHLLYHQDRDLVSEQANLSEAEHYCTSTELPGLFAVIKSRMKSIPL